MNPEAVVPDAIALLADAGLADEELPVTGEQWLNVLSGGRTTPQVFVNGQVIGGGDDLQHYLKNRKAGRNAA